MKRLFFPFAFFALLAASCGMEGVVSDQLKRPGDGPEKKDTSAAAVVAQPDTVPHEVRKGKKSDWAYMPDSSFNQLVIGSPESFADYWKKNGANITYFDKKHAFASYLTSHQEEWMTVYLTKNKRGKEVAYGLVLQKNVEGSPRFPGKPFGIAKANIVTGNNIYIGMSKEYVMGVYLDQPLTEWQRGDTLYLQYRPQEKDAKYHRRTDWRHYVATYKFVNDRLRRIEYFTDPADLEAR